MPVPIEFTQEAAEEASGPEAFRPYQGFLASRQPVIRSLSRIRG